MQQAVNISQGLARDIMSGYTKLIAYTYADAEMHELAEDWTSAQYLNSCAYTHEANLRRLNRALFGYSENQLDIELDNHNPQA